MYYIMYIFFINICFNIIEQNKYLNLPKEFSSKLREFQMDRENNIINSIQNKK